MTDATISRRIMNAESSLRRCHSITFVEDMRTEIRMALTELNGVLIRLDQIEHDFMAQELCARHEVPNFAVMPNSDLIAAFNARFGRQAARLDEALEDAAGLAYAQGYTSISDRLSLEEQERARREYYVIDQWRRELFRRINGD